MTLPEMITIQATPAMIAAMEATKNLLRQAVFDYSEWLDSQGLVVGDLQSSDKRSHEDLVNDFFTQTTN